MKINKEAKSLNMRWEKEYGYSQLDCSLMIVE